MSSRGRKMVGEANVLVCSAPRSGARGEIGPVGRNAAIVSWGFASRSEAGRQEWQGCFFENYLLPSARLPVGDPSGQSPRLLRKDSPWDDGAQAQS